MHWTAMLASLPLIGAISLRDPLVSELSRLGYGKIRQVTQLNSGGGERGLRTTHRRYDTNEGPVFCKISSLPKANEAFAAEAASLRALRTAVLGWGLVRIPKPIASGAMPLGGASAQLPGIRLERVSHCSIITTRARCGNFCLISGLLDGDGGYLALEWVDFEPLGSSRLSTLGSLGEALADLHTAPQPPGASNAPWATRAPSFGFGCETYLGSYPQPNGWERTFSDFFVIRRLLPQLEAACGIGGMRRDGYGGGGRAWDGGGRDASDDPIAAIHRGRGRVLDGAADPSLLLRLRQLREPVLQSAEAMLERLADPPSLLHGELWTGSFGAVSGSSEPVLFDPACWYGLAECDLALFEVQGRPADAFYEAYHAMRPRADGFEQRLQLFVLYHRLVELNRLASPSQTSDASSSSSLRDSVGNLNDCLSKVVKLMDRIAAEKS